MDIEVIATSEVKNSISITDLLKAEINDGDKSVSWDGFVYVYSNKSKEKSKLIGRVPVQVKGWTRIPDLNLSEIHYQVDRPHLENYLHEGGVVFFVVGISPDGTQNKIYYASLLPVNLQQVLENCGDSKALTFKEFPKDNDAKTRFFQSFLEDMRKQASFANTKIRSIEELGPSLECITTTLYVEDPTKVDPIKILLDDETNLYANIKGDSIPHPILPLPVGSCITQDVDATITADKKIFYSQYQLVHSKADTTLKIGKSMKFVFPGTEPGKIHVNYIETHILGDAIIDLDFWLSTLQAEQFEINGVPLPVSLTKEKIEEFDVSGHQQKLINLKRLEILFETLNLNKQVDLSTMDRKSRFHIDVLMKALVDKELVTDLKEDLPDLIVLDIGNQKVLMFFRKTEIPGSYLISDFFKTPLDLAKEVDGKMLLVPQYSILTNSNYLELSNVDCDVILRRYKELQGHPDLYERANQTLLDLLLAYDESKDDRKDLLEVAKMFAEWLIELPSEETELSKEICELNRLQVFKRERLLTKAEKRFLWQIAEKPDLREEIKVGAYLLLDNQEAAELHYELLNQEVQKSFKEFPIYRFWNSKMEE